MSSALVRLAALVLAVTVVPVVELNAGTEVLKPVQSIALNPRIPELDGQWLGSIVASDGCCYFFSSTHDPLHGAAFFRYNPGTGALTVLAEDITKVCGEDPARVVPQGKVHSAIAKAGGWLYFATHHGLQPGEDASDYPGSHLLGYELATGRFRDYGVLRPHHSVYSGLAVDGARRLAYVYVVPFVPEDVQQDGVHLYRVDLDSGAKEDLGRMMPQRPGCYCLFVDQAGRCWFIVDGILFCARPESHEVERHPLAQMASFRDRPEKISGWLWAQGCAHGQRCLFTMGESLWLFDADRGIESPDAIREVAMLGPGSLGVTADERRVYFVQRAERRPWGEQGGADGDLHLYSVGWATPCEARIVDQGLIEDDCGRRPWKLESLATDGHGTLYTVGAWRLLPGDDRRLGVWKGPPANWCGQFFSVFVLRGSTPDASPTATVTVEGRP